MLIYVGCASRELGRVILLSRRLEEAGNAITAKWWTDVQARGGTPDAELSDRAQVSRARACLDGIDRAQLVWLLWPSAVSHGTAAELGYSLARAADSDKRVIVSGAYARYSIFTSLGTERYASDIDALEAVLAYAAERSPVACVP